ncbi:MAG TPA: hypothetical protein VJO53_08415 [Candidatus Acidoferrales bacterium]|nr:hypothetical protein [Candidatus Acidoferrales bacterium]
MPYHFEFDSTHRILRCRLEGGLTDESIKEYYRAVPKFVALTDPRASVFDLSAVTSLEVSPETVRELAKWPPAMPHPERPRIVIAASPAIFGLARMFELLGQVTRPNFHVVRSEKEALVILGVPQTNYEPVATK